MAVFLLKAKQGPAYVPPPAAGSLHRCPVGPFADWIEKLPRRITGGCGGGNYCPDTPVTRAQMAVFLLKSAQGSSYTPPACRQSSPTSHARARSPTGSRSSRPRDHGRLRRRQVLPDGFSARPNGRLPRQDLRPAAVRTGRYFPARAGSGDYLQRHSDASRRLFAFFVAITTANYFYPSTIHIRVGDTIKWPGGSSVQHSTTGVRLGLGPTVWTARLLVLVAHSRQVGIIFPTICKAQPPLPRTPTGSGFGHRRPVGRPWSRSGAREARRAGGAKAEISPRESFPSGPAALTSARRSRTGRTGCASSRRRSGCCPSAAGRSRSR